MGSVELTETEVLEVGQQLLREAHHSERIKHAQTTLELLQEIAGHLNVAKETLFLRLLVKYGLEGRKGLRFSSDGKSVEFQDAPTNPAAPFFNPPPPLPIPVPPPPPPTPEEKRAATALADTAPPPTRRPTRHRR